MLALIEPMAAGGASDFACRRARDNTSSSVASPAAIGAAKGLDLTLSLRPGDAAGTVRGNPPAANHGIDAAALCQGVFMAHQGDKFRSEGPRFDPQPPAG